MNEDYEKLQAMINNKKLDDAEFQAKLNETFNKEYQETGIYNGYDVKEAANKDFKEIRQPHLVGFEGETEVKQKEVSSEHKSKLFKRAMIILATAATLGSSVLFVDFVNHPEDYLTTHPDFDGSVVEEIKSFSDFSDRILEDFGIGGR